MTNETETGPRFYRDHCTLNLDAMRLWVADLRTEGLPQATGALHVAEVGFCCLGVACETMMKLDMGLVREVTSPRGATQVHIGYRLKSQTGADGAVLPVAVRHWLGLPDGNPIIATPSELIADGCHGTCGWDDGGHWGDGGFGHLHATGANDGMKWTFAQIADAIEAYYGLAEEVTP